MFTKFQIIICSIVLGFGVFWFVGNLTWDSLNATIIPPFLLITFGIFLLKNKFNRKSLIILSVAVWLIWIWAIFFQYKVIDPYYKNWGVNKYSWFKFDFPNKFR